jgi:hypothetical protein
MELSKLGAAAIPIIENLLSSKDYRLRLGGLVAVADMPPQLRAQLPGSIMDRVRTYTGHIDPAIRDAAVRALQPS